MGFYTNLRLKAMDFWKRNKKKILICLIIFIIVVIINTILKNMPKKLPEPSTTFKPHLSVINDIEVPEKYQKPIEDLVEKYFNYCNNQEYENAYNMITEECRKSFYPTLESFKGYVDYVFQGKKKVYVLQSYSVVNNCYVYSIRIMDDFLANGTTDGYYYYEEKLILKEENGNFKFSIGGFIEQNNPEIAIEDDYMKIEILDKLVEYESETYKIKITNKTDDKYIVIADGKQNNEVKLNLGSRQDAPDEMVTSLVVNPKGFRFEEIKFTKFFDSENTSKGLIFGAVRILDKYDHSVGTTQEDLDSAVKLYSIEIPLN